jgi:hypothetical protein
VVPLKTGGFGIVEPSRVQKEELMIGRCNKHNAILIWLLATRAKFLIMTVIFSLYRSLRFYMLEQ